VATGADYMLRRPIAVGVGDCRGGLIAVGAISQRHLVGDLRFSGIGLRATASLPLRHRHGKDLRSGLPCFISGMDRRRKSGGSLGKCVRRWKQWVSSGVRESSESFELTYALPGASVFAPGMHRLSAPG
jgi:hypothetical protein